METARARLLRLLRTAWPAASVREPTCHGFPSAAGADAALHLGMALALDLVMLGAAHAHGQRQRSFGQLAVIFQKET